MEILFFLSIVGFVALLAVAAGVMIAIRLGPDWLVDILQASRILPSPRDGGGGNNTTTDGELIRWIAHQAERIVRKGDGRRH